MPNDYREFVGDAVRQINDLMGAEWLSMAFVTDSSYSNLIEIGGKRPTARTIYVHGDHGDDSTKGVTHLYYENTGDIISAEVTLPENPQEPGDKRKIALHEIAHSVGLAHDENDPHSIMFPYFTELNQAFTDADKALLKLAYGRHP